MSVDAGLVTNCCIIALPGPSDAARIGALIAEMGQIVRGAPSLMPHLTLAYFGGVTKAQAMCIRPHLAHLSAHTPPLALRADGLVREPDFFVDYPGAVILSADKTPLMCALFDALCRVGRAQCAMQPRIAPADWRAHITVLYTSDPRGGALDRMEALAPRLHFTAAYLLLSYRADARAPWVALGTYPLRAEARQRALYE